MIKTANHSKKQRHKESFSSCQDIEYQLLFSVYFLEVSCVPQRPSPDLPHPLQYGIVDGVRLVSLVEQEN